MNRIILLGLVAILLIGKTVFANEGMWLPILLEKYTMEQMRQQGFKLTAEDLYSINQACLKDAVVGLVHLENPHHHFCTGEIVSTQGLLLTNHHCGYGAIQNHSTLENDYLTYGFWAMEKSEELPNEGLGVSFLKRMEDVTPQVLSQITGNTDEQTRDSLIDVHIAGIELAASENGTYLAKVKPFFAGNEYYLSVYKIYRDVRLVGAPPSAIGKFGGDTDNWMWPRHTGDFSMFRIYADKNNEPAGYSEENVPFTPAKVFDIAIDGVQKGDFTMVMGYPGTTTEYLPSMAVTMQKETINPGRIKIRTQSLNTLKTAMEKDPLVRIQYASKAAGIANSWKKWIGENKGLTRLDAVAKKQELEEGFMEWVNQSESRKKEYGLLLTEYAELYKFLAPYSLTHNYFFETIFESDVIDLAGKCTLLKQINKGTAPEKTGELKNNLMESVNVFFKDYHLKTDQKLFEDYISFFYYDIDKNFHPEILRLIDTDFKGDVNAFTQWIYSQSMIPYPDKLGPFISDYTPAKQKKLEKDPLVVLFSQSLQVYRTLINPIVTETQSKISKLHRLYMKGLREYQSNKIFYPDANSTFRVSFGQVDDYKPMDAVTYRYYTTLTGIMEKDNPGIYDYKVPEHLKRLYCNKDFGRYANPDGSMPVCFTASNHTTGGNSGSPVLNSRGQLIGINFDRNWEGTMSDLMYDPDMCRNIALDVRYILFIIDKYAGAGYLLDEMNLIKSKPSRELPVQIAQ
ncbi:MAG TPA: serine protease [Marinilabiliales bacterium]|nr:MAG: hypothetical protein A2W96_03875 [Bacteroidetes bacterium GWD2_40_43]OFX94764.1 MAG: hypothetical protein A2W97_18780 [Bacteroidetes bacterium GWE2_40_63]OFY24706.1 MAG: hypothetical protein A2W88_16530 [Bacteroidetes bacterium GWF2_40_13]OFZ27626.1 MAG: hypothetical protein A2437_05840 [Bacteroidetes bacterium RIFOXYC2_FULL_40_12]HAM98537.1 serine protease [Marinilabiliales bacterium]